MDEIVFEFYKKDDQFHKIIALHEEKDLEWESFSRMVPICPRGWFELSRLLPEDRIEFTLGFWFSQLTFSTSQADLLEQRIADFFANVDEIGIFATQSTKESFFEMHMVYGLKENRGFLHGSPPANSDNVLSLVKQFAQVSFPEDYLSFLQIHDGFGKFIDGGVVKIRNMARVYHHFQNFLSQKIEENSVESMMIHPPSLIPFYESMELNGCQCFNADWYTGEEIGNLFFSESSFDRNDFAQAISFPTFSHWLTRYLEGTWPTE